MVVAHHTHVEFFLFLFLGKEAVEERPPERDHLLEVAEFFEFGRSDVALAGEVRLSVVFLSLIRMVFVVFRVEDEPLRFHFESFLVVTHVTGLEFTHVVFFPARTFVDVGHVHDGKFFGNAGSLEIRNHVISSC